MESVELGNEGNPGPKLDNSFDDTVIRNEIPVDRISDLQEDIICRILSFLPAESVVATRFLSKSWRLHWTKVTSFNFDDQWWLDRGISYLERPGGGGMNFVDFVNMFLLHQNNEVSMNSFRLIVNDLDFPFIYLHIWVNTAIARNIRVLDLRMLPDTDEYYPDEYEFYPGGYGVVHDFYCDYGIYLPVPLYTCGTLEVLKLFGPFLVNVPHVVCLPKLTLLQLHSVKYESNDAFCKLISGCPVLESLVIYRCHKDDMLVFSISSPILKSLKYFHGFDMCRRCPNNYAPAFKLQINTPALEYLSFNDHLSKEIIVVHELASLNEVKVIFSSPKSVLDLFQAFDHVKILDLSGGIMENLMEANKKFSASFQRLTKLVIPVWDSPLSCLIDFINCCPTLEVLEISTYVDFEFERVPIIVPKCFSYSLTHVSFTGFGVFEDGNLTWFKFVVSSALVLKRFHIHASSSVDLCKLFGFLENLVVHSRSSPTCNFSFSSASFEMDSMDV